MRLQEFKHDVGRVLRGCIVLLALAALTGPSALSRDRGGGSQGSGGASTDGRADTWASTSDRAAAMRGEATGGLGLTTDPSRAAATGTNGGPGAGESSFAMSAADVTESFGSLTKQQQARVMRRCKDVIAKPGEADPNQLALCQTLAAMGRR